MRRRQEGERVALPPPKARGRGQGRRGRREQRQCDDERRRWNDEGGGGGGGGATTTPRSPDANHRFFYGASRTVLSLENEMNASTSYLARGRGNNIIRHLKKNKHEKLSFARSHRQSFGNSEAISKLVIIKATQFFGRMINIFTNCH